MADPAPRSHVIADRYLTSPAALVSQPFGPVDALDTHSGRGAQVRIVFVGGEWEEARLADAVARWCGIGCSEVCGVLDFGRHGERWFLVLPPSLGLPVERWRMLRRPTADDAARLTLAFGRLTERVAAAGFSPDAASLADVAVGPGPTPFLERPLLHAASGPPAVGEGDGQRVLAAVWDAALGSLEPPESLREWAERARAGEFPGLPECLDELERRGVPAPGAEPGSSEAPPGLERLFDEHFDLDGPAVTAPRGRSRFRLAGFPLGIMSILGVVMLLGSGTHHGAATTALGTVTAPTTTAVVPTSPVRRSSHPPVTAGRTSARHRAHPSAVRHHRRHGTVRAKAATTPARAASTPPAPTAPPATPPAATTSTSGTSAGAVNLPAPGGTTLPAP
jgi:hypothetical protein